VSWILRFSGKHYVKVRMKNPEKFYEERGKRRAAAAQMQPGCGFWKYYLLILVIRYFAPSAETARGALFMLTEKIMTGQF